MTLQLHRPDGKGGLERRRGGETNWRAGLRARRWRAAELRNSEMNPTGTAMSIVFWLALAGLTFVLLVVGYGSHFWH